MTGDAEMPTRDLNKVRVALGRPDGSHVADKPKEETREPEAQTNTQRSCERAVENRDRTWRPAHQDRLSESAMDWSFEAWDLSVHQITTPPPNEKNDRKKLDAANAMDRPNTIWINLRKPPDVSPNASDSPVTMMMITAMILATGPSTDCRIWLRGCSHGILEPAANAALAARQAATNTSVETTLRPNGEIALMFCPLL